MSAMDKFTSDVEKAVAAALAAAGAEGTQFQTEIPSVEGADLAVPCFTMAKAMRKAPAAIAQELASKSTFSLSVSMLDRSL